MLWISRSLSSAKAVFGYMQYKRGMRPKMKCEPTKWKILLWIIYSGCSLSAQTLKCFFGVLRQSILWYHTKWLCSVEKCPILCGCFVYKSKVTKNIFRCAVQALFALNAEICPVFLFLLLFFRRIALSANKTTLFLFFFRLCLLRRQCCRRRRRRPRCYICRYHSLIPFCVCVCAR